jgi:hypothetical protein
MESCWANGLGSCAGGLSREHVISKAVLKSDRIFVQGYEWCLNEEKEVGLSSLVKKHLCRHHNSTLSVIDDAGARVLEGFGSENECDSQIVLDGPLFERWLLKCAINVVYGDSGSLGVGMTDSVPGKVPWYLLEVVFGRQPFVCSMGAYFLYPEGEFRHREGEIIVAPIRKSDEIGGVYFHLRGLDVFLSLLPGHTLTTLGDIDLTLLPEHVLRAKLEYRSRVLLTRVKDSPERTIRFHWNGVETPSSKPSESL